MKTAIEAYNEGLVSASKGVEAVETARYAPQTAIADLAQKQATLEQTQQQNILRGYNVRGAADIEQVAQGIQQEEANLAQAEYGKVFTEAQQNQKEMERRKLRIDQYRKLEFAARQNPQQASEFRLSAQREQDALAKIQEKQLATQEKHLGNQYAAIAGVRDQTTLDLARRDIGEQAVAAARVAGVPEENLERVRADAIKDIPRSWGPSGEYWKEKMKFQILPTKDALAVQREELAAKREEAKARGKEADERQTKIKADRAEARQEHKYNSENYRDALKDTNEQRKNLLAFSPARKLELQALVKEAKEVSEKFWQSDEEKALSTAQYELLKEELTSFDTNKTTANTAFLKAEKNAKFYRDLIEEKNKNLPKEEQIEIPTEEPLPNLESQRKQIQQEFNKYTPSTVAKQEGITLEQFAQNYSEAAAKKGRNNVTIEEILRVATQGESPLFSLKPTESKVEPSPTSNREPSSTSITRDIKTILRELNKLEEPPSYVNQDVKDRYKKKRASLLEERRKALGEPSNNVLGRSFKY